MLDFPSSHSHSQVTIRKRRSAIWGALLLGFLVMILVAAGAFFLPQLTSKSSTITDYSGTGEQDITIVIPEGANGSDIAKILVDAEVIATAKPFVDAFAQDERSVSIQHGPYKLKTHMSANAALAALLDPANKTTLQITVPEGFTTWQVYARLAKLMDVSEEKVKAAAAGDIGLPSVAQGNPEGWFAPLTYPIDESDTPRDILSRMVEKRVEQMRSLQIPEDQWEDVLIRASIVEKEGNPTDFGKISQVINNRLKDENQTHGFLQMDAVVLYGLGRNSGDLTREELLKDTPYNTYVNKGLPPTPINTPSNEAIQAALHPEEGNWLYYVTVNLKTGETKFTDNLDEFNTFVEEYKKWREENPSY